MLQIRRPLSALFALLYLLLAAGGEVLQHGGSDPAPAPVPRLAHLHAPGDSDHDCPPPPHDETHCPACKLTGLHFIPTVSGSGELAAACTTLRTPNPGNESAPAIRSHAQPGSRAPPLA
ncbi:hypothetical protein [Longimicrobium terrae]|uniref:DUF2946 domain-containing protein n=1 Tax=Longimicrobium terrae TaxID=1639882 RepID=A0A841H0K8_9BACT|nr:hypothetical protein [Longimicrobium terrae]MBB4637138.1 hypothetical protein [Longimicrobium terrae]MBB6071601.1 hypothetical protein [Longimicrobium terrae]NNC29980.1 hypothetical protein [Longimicrobium terrae]